ncbi:hypothetical protein GQ42DRAFT_47325 [Ramicandelaber brevisporus]|nr:hypothetical protein GQ42DRAFT_47325 [Ramicandelaber brevisporus]
MTTPLDLLDPFANPLPQDPAQATKLQQARKHVEAGNRAVALQHHDQAIAELGKAAKLLSAVYGETSPKVADVLLSYGRALLESGIRHNNLFAEEQMQEANKQKTKGNAKDDGEAPAASANDAAVAAASAVAATKRTDLLEKASTKFMFSGDADDDEEEGEDDDDGDDDGNDDGDKDEEQNPAKISAHALAADDDLAAAWEVLEVARLIYSQIPGNTPEVMLRSADVLSLLSETSLESGNAKEAIQDAYKALLIVKEYGKSEKDEGRLAEAHYKLAVVLENCGKSDQAIAQAQEAINVLTRRLERQQERKEEEASETTALIEEVKSKIADWKLPTLSKKLFDAIAADNSSTFTASSAKSNGDKPAQVNDLTSLVRSSKRQRDTAVSAATDTAAATSNMETKRARVEDASDIED